MDFSLNSDQQMLTDTLNRYVSKNYLVNGAGGNASSSNESATDSHWKAFAEMGIFGLTIDEALGGVGGTATDAAVVMEAFGNGLVTEPWVTSTLVAGGLIARGNNVELKESLLPRLCAGELRLALAQAEPQSRHSLHDVLTSAMAQGEYYILNGRKSLVVQGGSADWLLVTARTEGASSDENGISLFLVNRAAVGVSHVTYSTLDGSHASDFVFENVRVSASAMLCAQGKALPLLDLCVDIGTAALCSEAVGIMSALLSTTLEYVKTRKQFGVAIGSFQALQHRLVDMHIHIEQAKSLSWLAASKVCESDVEERRRVVSAAKWRIGAAARVVGQEAIQMHGGIGMTDELIVGHYVKRLMTIEQTFGDSMYHLKRFIRSGKVH